MSGVQPSIYDRPLYFEYADFTGHYEKPELHWRVTFFIPYGSQPIRITFIIKGMHYDYLEYLTSKGAYFIDDPENPIKGIWGNKELNDFLDRHRK